MRLELWGHVAGAQWIAVQPGAWYPTQYPTVPETAELGQSQWWRLRSGLLTRNLAALPPEHEQERSGRGWLVRDDRATASGAKVTSITSSRCIAIGTCGCNPATCKRCAPCATTARAGWIRTGVPSGDFRDSRAYIL